MKINYLLLFCPSPPPPTHPTLLPHFYLYTFSSSCSSSPPTSLPPLSSLPSSFPLLPPNIGKHIVDCFPIFSLCKNNSFALCIPPFVDICQLEGLFPSFSVVFHCSFLPNCIISYRFLITIQTKEWHLLVFNVRHKFINTHCHLYDWFIRLVCTCTHAITNFYTIFLSMAKRLRRIKQKVYYFMRGN